MKIDPYKHEERYLNWKESIKISGIPNISKLNSDILLQYLTDMEIGINVGHGSKKGSRSYIRLNTLKDKMGFIMKKILELYDVEDLSKVTESQIHFLFSKMEKGDIKRSDGIKYKAVGDYVKIFKSFWHWYQKISKKKGIEIADITTDLDTKEEKPDWVYLTEKEVKLLCENVRYEYKVLIMFLFDTGIRAPTELINIKVSDFFNNFKELNIRDEISKTFGRRIKLMLSSDLVRDYVKTQKLSDEDYVFNISPTTTNQYLKRFSERLFGDKASPAGQKYSELTMYDFRHIACCYWLPRYKSESALKYRFGWKGSDKIHYYSELLGMKDTISEEDMLVDVTRTEIEKELQKTQKQNELLQERVATLEKFMNSIMNFTDASHQIVEREKEVILLQNGR